jgi:hypothetical protein
VTRLQEDVATISASILVGLGCVAGALVTIFGTATVATLVWVTGPLLLALALVLEAAEVGSATVDADDREPVQEVSE